jgi:hypothetical protein
LRKRKEALKIQRTTIIKKKKIEMLKVKKAIVQKGGEKNVMSGKNNNNVKRGVKYNIS